jgi:hypothetical protein
MIPSRTSQFVSGMISELLTYRTLCEEILSLAASENQALAGQSHYRPLEFHQKREKLLPDIQSLLSKLRQRRITWQQMSLAERETCREVKPLFQSIQSLLMKVLMLDRENQQAMLRRGLVPAKHTPAAVTQQPHFVAGLYQRNSTK